MKLALSILLAVDAVSAQTVLLEPYAQCGGLVWQGAWECEPGYTCSPVGTSAFPGYKCYPNIVPIVTHAFLYGQCGGQGFVGPTLCAPGWNCVVANAFFSTCVESANTTTPADPTPDLANPGSFCGESAVERSSPDGFCRCYYDAHHYGYFNNVVNYCILYHSSYIHCIFNFNEIVKLKETINNNEVVNLKEIINLNDIVN